MPRMIAAEIYGSIQTAVADDLPAPPDMPKTHETIALSIGATQSAFQALDVVRRSRGLAVTVGNDDMLRWQYTLSEREGLYGEPAAVAPAVAVEQLRATGVIGADDSVVLLVTASGLKDQSAMVATMPDLPVADGNLESVVDVLEKRYGFCSNGSAP